MYELIEMVPGDPLLISFTAGCIFMFLVLGMGAAWHQSE